MKTEIESGSALSRHLDTVGSLDHVVVQGVDLAPEAARVQSASVSGALFLGCAMGGSVLAHLLSGGATVFPMLHGRPFRCYRPSLYTAEELLRGYRPGVAGSLLEHTVDGVIYRYYDALRRADQPMPVVETLAQRLHDHAIDDALTDLLHDPQHPRRVVAIMGGHGLRRDEESYAAVARIGRGLGRAGYMVTTGGGPGAMEAGNLGAWLSNQEVEVLDEAVRHLAAAPHYTSDGFLDLALEVRSRLSGCGESLAIPTWFYGHEPTNVFASHVAKYFANSLREEGLLAIATHGVIYAPGSAGTIQEVFMDAAQNHYMTFGCASPMVFLGAQYWTDTKPVYPLLRHLAEGRSYADLVCLSDDEEEIVRFIVEHPPVPPTRPE